MIRFFLLLFISLSANAQKLELKIDDISIDDSDALERKFIVHYHLENLTNQHLLFFQDLDGMVPSTGGAMTPMPYFKLFEEDALIEQNIFTGWRKEDTQNTSKPKQAALNEKQITFLKDNPNSILGKLQAIEPGEKQFFSQAFYWDRKRYHLAHDIEYYLDENTKYFMEITMVMLKQQYEKQLPEELYKQIAEDNRYVVGSFTSNKHAIDFGKKKEK